MLISKKKTIPLGNILLNSLIYQRLPFGGFHSSCCNPWYAWLLSLDTKCELIYVGLSYEGRFHLCIELVKNYCQQAAYLHSHIEAETKWMPFSRRLFQMHFCECIWILISIKILLKFVPMLPVNNIPALVRIMAWRQPGDKPLSKPMMDSFMTHICFTQPQWVKWSLSFIHIAGAHFMNDSTILIQIWWKFHSAVIQVVVKWSLGNFAYGTTAEVLWHVQNISSNMIPYNVQWSYTKTNFP